MLMYIFAYAKSGEMRTVVTVTSVPRKVSAISFWRISAMSR
jgi:hypothetical protein